MTDHLFRVTICQCPSVTQNVAMSIQLCLNDRERKSASTDGQLAFSKALLTYLPNDWLVFIISTECISSSIKNYLYSFEPSNSPLTPQTLTNIRSNPTQSNLQLLIFFHVTFSPRSWTVMSLHNFLFTGSLRNLCLFTFVHLCSCSAMYSNKLFRHISSCYSPPLSPSLCPMSVWFSKPSFLIMNPINFNSLSLILCIIVIFAPIFLKSLYLPPMLLWASFYRTRILLT